jgi:subtilisin family serine protease
MRRSLATFLGAVMLVSCGDDASSPEPAGPELSRIGAQTAQVLVVLDPTFAPGGHAANQSRALEMAAEMGVSARHGFGTAVFGFAGSVPAGRLEALSRDPRVASVELEEVFTYAAQAGQEVPTGVDRIEADRNPAAGIGGDGGVVNLDVAVIDGGIDGDHPDLNVAGGANFAGGPIGNWNDGGGHGTHVAGTIGALDNGIGVVGVAPGVRLWAVKVCKNGGLCFNGDMVAGIDWVAAQKSSGAVDFAAANMSISTSDDAEVCDGSSGAVHEAICGLVGSGVVFTLAAGNDSRVKQAYPEVLAVSAMADFDGLPGGLGSATCRSDQDESLAGFSNWGASVDIAAPGVCITSTWTGGGYNTISGTSMAAPHVAGAVALYLHANNLAPAQNASGVDNIESKILGSALPQSDPCSYANERGSNEPMLFVNGAAFGGDGSCDTGTTDPVTDIAIVSVSAPSAATQGDAVNVDVLVRNVGNQNVVDDIVVSLHDDTDGAPIGIPQTVAGLGAGAQATVSFSWDTNGASLGGHALTASQAFTDDDDTNDAGSTTVTLNAPGSGGAPTVAACTPASAGLNQQVTVTVAGSDFQAGASADFGERVNVQNVTFVSSSELAVRLKVQRRAAPGPRDVTVTNPDGQSGSLAGCFTVN